jgi:excisionase family DNA binding protein
VSVSEHDRLLTPAEVAALFHVDPKTVTRWANRGRLPSIRTLGGHRRFRWSDLEPHVTFNEPVDRSAASG